MFSWCNRNKATERGNQHPCRLHLLRLEERKVLNADPLLAEFQELVEADHGADSPDRAAEEFVSRATEEFDVHKSDRIDGRESNGAEDQLRTEVDRTQRRVALQKAVRRVAQVTAETEELGTVNRAAGDELTHEEPPQRDPVSESVESPEAVVVAQPQPLNETATEPADTVAEPVAIRDPVDEGNDDTSQTDEPADDTQDSSGTTEDSRRAILIKAKRLLRAHGEEADSIRNEHEDETDEDGVVEDPAAAVPVASPEVAPGDGDRTDQHQPQPTQDRGEEVGRHREQVETQLQYAKASAPAGRAAASHDTAQLPVTAMTSTATATSETAKSETDEGSASVGQGALLMVTLGKPLTRFVAGDDHDTDATTDAAAAPKRLLAPVDRKRDRKKSASRSELARHRAQKRKVSVTPPATSSPQQRDEFAATLASYTTASAAQSGGQEQQDNNNGMTALATGGVAFGSSVMFIQHCRSAVQSRRGGSRPTMASYTATTEISED